MVSTTKLVHLLDSAIQYKKGTGRKPSKGTWSQLAIELEVLPNTTLFEMSQLKNQLMFNPTPESYQKHEYERCDQCGSLVDATKPCYVCSIKSYKGEEE
jgi:hypothetical protein